MNRNAVHIATYHFSKWLAEIEFDLYATVLIDMLVKDYDTAPRPFHHVTLIEVTSKDIHESYGAQELYDEVVSFLNDTKSNHGICIIEAGCLVFSEEPITINPLMFKLTVGNNLLGSQELDLNAWINSDPTMLECFGHLIR